MQESTYEVIMEKKQFLRAEAFFFRRQGLMEAIAGDWMQRDPKTNEGEEVVLQLTGDQWIVHLAVQTSRLFQC